ncbi:hypothetical protein WOLCODRAFT_28873 [Wolfiporia cocos MD-104 SS10]|uniref:Uncharacterized protein n=1 Tax=Wolfiporia cocos (strain MD-104) TaxID=742152 RepID=A0A2H3J5N2_WOLCO|nr:hypothetical protein WOLCODRAFT_28873 [Wolfiporia cocos MD-104 SS10]
MEDGQSRRGCPPGYERACLQGKLSVASLKIGAWVNLRFMLGNCAHGADERR